MVADDSRFVMLNKLGKTQLYSKGVNNGFRSHMFLMRVVRSVVWLFSMLANIELCIG